MEPQPPGDRGMRPGASLPLVGDAPPEGISAAGLARAASAACSLDDGCITCGDVAVPLTVVESTEADARCRDEQGREELVATELVGPVVPGDVLLVHAGVALEQLDQTRLHE